MKRRIARYWQQAFPRVYWTRVDHINGKSVQPQLVIWRMWLGRCYDVTRIDIYQPTFSVTLSP